jgi:peptide deformylase
LLTVPTPFRTIVAVEIVTFPADILHERARVVPSIDENIRAWLDQMKEAMKRNGGVGLAAPQVGLPFRMFVTGVPGEAPRAFVNPEIVERAGRLTRYQESCLSFPGIYADIHRPVWVRVAARDDHGERFEMTARGLLARVIQHETDHLNGVVFVDHLSEKKRARLIRRLATVC